MSVITNELDPRHGQPQWLTRKANTQNVDHWIMKISFVNIYLTDFVFIVYQQVCNVCKEWFRSNIRLKVFLGCRRNSKNALKMEKLLAVYDSVIIYEISFLTPTYLKLGLGDACAGQVIVTDVRSWFWIVVTLSSDGNFGGDPPTGSEVTRRVKIKGMLWWFFKNANSFLTMNLQVVAWMEVQQKF